MTAQTPETIIGLELEGKGFQELNKAASEHLTHWDRIESTVGRLGRTVDGMAGRLATLGGGLALGKLAYDWMKVEDAANRAALAQGIATGDQRGYQATAQQLRAIGKKYGIPEAETGAGIGSLTSLVGGTVGGNTVGAMAAYRNALGLSAPQIGGTAGNLALFTRQGPNSLERVLNGLTAQSLAAGMTGSGQIAAFHGTVSDIVGALARGNPSIAGPGLPGKVGAMYGTAQGANPAFRDPSLFGSAVMGVDGTLQNGYGNPRLQAAMQMAGIGYWDQRKGLSDPHNAQKILAYSQRMYGKGTVEQDLFLRSNFGGIPGADFLQSLASGQSTYEDLVRRDRDPKARGRAHDEIGRRDRATRTTPGSRVQQAQSTAGDWFGDHFGGVGHWVADHLLETMIGGYGAAKLAGPLARRGMRGARASSAARRAAELERRGAMEAFGLTGGELSRAGRGLQGLSKALRFAGPIGDAAAFLLDDGSGLDSIPGVGKINKMLDPLGHGGLADEDSIMAHHRWQRMQRQYGPEFWKNRKAMAQARTWGYTDPGTAAGKMFNEALGKVGGRGLSLGKGDHDHTFGKAVDDFKKAVDALTGKGGGGGRVGASFPGGAGGGPGAALGATAPGLMLAAMLTGGGSGGGGGGGGTIPALFPSGGQTSSGGSGGASHVGGGGWKPCTLTWYDPGLGGINSSHGQKDPHSRTASGEPYDRNKFTCAAPPAYSFGTMIAFRRGGKEVTCRVNDRGGAIQGAHFDLSVAAKNAIGTGTGQFKVVGSSGGKHGGKHGSSSGGSPAPGTVSASRSAASDASDWLAGGSAAGVGGGAPGGGGSTINVNVDGRRIDQLRRATRGT